MADIGRRSCGRVQPLPQETLVDARAKIRNYKRKSDRGNTGVDVLERAAQLVREGTSIRQSAKSYDICHVTLTRYISRKNKRANEPRPDPQVDWKPLAGYYGNRQVFPPIQETALVTYIETCSDIYFGLTPRDLRCIAYLCGKHYNVTMPRTWSDNETAGADWLSSFLKRHPSLSIRTLEATSIGRASSFNRASVSKFFDKLSEVYDRYSFTANDVWNMDETGVTTVQKPSKIIARKGIKQIGAMTSAEIGQLITLTVAVNAAGNAIPPMFIFPRVRFYDHFIRDGPTGCIGTGNKSGWTTETEFLIFLNHFVDCVRPSQERPVLILLDNHKSHLAPKCLDFAKTNGVVMLSFPPHCTHRLQPLDRSVFRPVKRQINIAMDAWIRNNKTPDGTVRPMTIFHIPSVLKVAFPIATTPTNIQHGFQKCGIFPFNREVFQDADFSPSFVTDRPNPEPAPDSRNEGSPGRSLVLDRPITPISGSTRTNESSINPVGVAGLSRANNISQNMAKFSPELVQPLPKSAPRKTKGGRKTRKSSILTDTPEKNALEEEYGKRQKKGAVKRKIKLSSPNQARAKTSARNKLDPESSSEEDRECFCLVCLEPFSSSKPGEEWVRCLDCQLWSHFSWSKKSKMYICHNCQSDGLSE